LATEEADVRKTLIATLGALSLVAMAQAQVPRVEHVFLVVEENQPFSLVIKDDSAMPYLNSLASKYAVAASYYATAHPSISNYFMLTTGKAIEKEAKVLGDTRTTPVSDDNVIRALRRGKKTWRSYAEGIPKAGYTGGNLKDSHYAKRHNPLAYFESDFDPADAEKNLVPFSQFQEDLKNSRLANYSFIVPNLLHDAHDVEAPDGHTRKANCGNPQALKQADDWLRDNIGPLIDSSVFKEKGLLVIVFDEACDDDESDGAGHDDFGGRVAMLLISPSVRPGYRSISLYHHEDTLALTLEVLGLDPSSFPGAARGAKSMAEFFAPGH
jgi:phospholipase C